jgi:hypothetical protein
VTLGELIVEKNEGLKSCETIPLNEIYAYTALTLNWSVSNVAVVCDKINFKNILLLVKSSIAEPELEPEEHHFGRTGAVTPCSSGSEGSSSNLTVEHMWIIKNDTNCKRFFSLSLFAFLTISII